MEKMEKMEKFKKLKKIFNLINLYFKIKEKINRKINLIINNSKVNKNYEKLIIDQIYRKNFNKF